jgi:hypothetical protein
LSLQLYFSHSELSRLGEENERLKNELALVLEENHSMHSRLVTSSSQPIPPRRIPPAQEVSALARSLNPSS